MNSILRTLHMLLLCLLFAPLATSAPSIANGDFEHGHLRPNWDPQSYNANLSIVRQPGHPANHVVRAAPHANPCVCDDGECPQVSLQGTMRGVVPSANYTITWRFMYLRALAGEDVFFYADGYRCPAGGGGCEVSTFRNVSYPTTVQARTWYTYSATFQAVPGATDGTMQFDLEPLGCSTAALFMDNFRLSGPL